MEDMDFENRIVAPEYMDNDSDVEFQLRPRTMSDYIGQTKVKENLSIYIEAAKRETNRLTMCFFTALRVSERQLLQV